MKKRFSRLISGILMLCMIFSMVAPLTLFAADGETATAESEYVFRETFSSGTVNTSSSKADVQAANGFFATTGKGVGWYKCENDALVYGSDNPVWRDDAYVSLVYTDWYGTRDLTDNFTLSLWLKPHSDSFSASFVWGDDSTTDEIFKINKNRFAIAGTIYPDAKVPKDEWSLIEIIYHYDETATATNGKTGATTSYTFMLNGEVVAANVSATEGKVYNNINLIRAIRYVDAGYSVDDITLSYGTKSLIDIPRSSLPYEVVFREEFSKGYVTTSNATTAITEMNGLWICTEKGSQFDLNDGTLKFTDLQSNDYLDIQFVQDAGTSKLGVAYDSTRKDLKRDFTLSVWVKPLTDTCILPFTWREDGYSTEGIFKVNNKFVINGTTYSDAALVKDEWSLIEVVFNYDAAATAVTGETGATTSYTFRLNGKNVATVDATYDFHNINFFRLFRWNSGNEYEIDDLTVSIGAMSLINVPRSSAPVKTFEELFKEDFSDNEYADGFLVNDTNGSPYTVSDGTFKWDKKMSYDSVGLDLAELDLAKDFVLSFKLKTAHETAMRLEWKDSDAAYTGDYEFSTRIENNRFVSKDDWKTTGRWYPNTVIKLNEWALVEIIFHYDENAIAVTGEEGAFTFYTILLNGERVNTVRTMVDFHEIDDFRLFYHYSDEFEIDDLTVTAANYSVATDGFNGGWDKKEYFFTTTKNPVTDYDYSFAVIGDPQCLAAWNTTALNTMYDWVANNVEAKKLKLVMGVGDIVNNDTAAEWAASVAATSKLNGLVPYTLVRGNHDGSAKFKEYFYDNNEAYVSQFTGESGGLYNNSDNFWKKIEVGSDKWLIIGLDVVPDDDELAWACGIVEANPDYKVIITTHEYLKQDGGLLDGDETDSASFYSGTDRNDGDDVWNKLGRKYKNISMIISGHIGSDYVVTSNAVGDNGNVVTQMLIDFQVLDDVLGGVGVVTMFYFKEGNLTVSVEAYATVQEAYFLRENQFKFNLDGSEVIKSPDVMFKEDFSSGSINTSSNVADFVEADGFRACVSDVASAPSIYTLENDTLKYTFRTPKDYVDIHFYHAGLERDLAQDFILSFWIKPDVDNLSMNDWAWADFDATGNYYKVDGVNAKETGIFKISNGYYQIGGKKYDNAKLNKDEWALVEIAYNYDDDAMSVSGEKGAVTSYTFLLNGEEIGTVPATYYFHNIDYWRIMQWVYGTYAIDDLIIATGTDTLIDTLSPAPTENVLKIVGASLNITNDINVKYTVNVPEGYENPYMVFEFNGKSYTVTNYTTRADGKLVFKFVGVVPQMIGDNISATLYATKDGVQESYVVENYSVKTYCVNMLAKTTDTKLITLLSDLLVYGAKSQLYMDYKTDAFVTDGLTLTPSTFTELTETDKALTGEADASVTWKGVALRYENAMAMRFAFKADADLVLKITINGRTTTYNVSELTAVDGVYTVYFCGILATEYGDVVTASFYNGETQVGQIATYSVNSYVYSKQGDSDTTLAELVKATYNYGASAVAYNK